MSVTYVCVCVCVCVVIYYTYMLSDTVVISAGVTRITDKMFYVAAVACMNSMTPEEQAEGRTFPKLSRIRQVSHAVALAVVEEAVEAGLATKISKEQAALGLSDYISRKMYFPSYHPLLGMKDTRR